MFHNKYQQYRLPFSLGGDLELKISVDEFGCEQNYTVAMYVVTRLMMHIFVIRSAA